LLGTLIRIAPLRPVCQQLSVPPQNEETYWHTPWH